MHEKSFSNILKLGKIKTVPLPIALWCSLGSPFCVCVCVRMTKATVSDGQVLEENLPMRDGRSVKSAPLYRHDIFG